jgi:predicted nucleic acid-binding protein
MLVPDVNILVYAHREAALNHQLYRGWIDELINGV